MGQFFSLKNSKFFSGLKDNWPIVASITTLVILGIFLFTSKNTGYLGNLIKGIFSNLLKGIWDTLLFTSRDIRYW